MAIVKATYTKLPTAIKASVRYYTQRPTKEGKRGKRELFGEFGKLTKADVYRMIENAPKGTFFYRLIVSPDPRREDAAGILSLERLTRNTLSRFARQKGLDRLSYAAVCHTDHTDIRHVHVIACFQKKLARTDLTALRELATDEALSHKREQEKRLRIRTPAAPMPARAGNLGRGGKTGAVVFQAGAAATHPTGATNRCPRCNLPTRLAWRDGALVCASCGFTPERAARGNIVRRARENGEGLGLSVGRGNA